MEKLEKDWVKYPVLYLDLNTEKYDTLESLENKLNGALVEWEKIYGAEPSEKSLAMRFEGIIYLFFAAAGCSGEVTIHPSQLSGSS